MIVKSNKMTPIFARISNSCMALTKPSRWGPARIPLKINPHRHRHPQLVSKERDHDGEAEDNDEIG